LIRAIIRQELFHRARHPRLIVWRSTYFILSLVLSTLFIGHFGFSSTSNWDRYTTNLGLSLIPSIVLSQLCLLTFFMPPAVGTALADDRKARSLELLAAAGVSRLKFVAGKVLAHSIRFGSYAASLIPLLVFALFYAKSNVFLGMAVLLLVGEYILFASALGTLASALFQRPYISALVTTIIMSAALFLWILVCQNWLNSEIEESLDGDLNQLLKFIGWWTAAFLLPVFLMIAIGGAALRLTPSRRPRKPLGKKVPLGEKGNPLIWRARLSRRFSRRRLFLYLAIVTAASALTAILSWNNFADLNLSMAALEVFALFMAATIASATAISAERETGALELLRSTPLSARTILGAKFWGVLYSILPLLAIPMTHTVVACLVGRGLYYQFIWMVAVGLIGCTLRLIIVGLAVTAQMPTVRSSIRWAMGLWMLVDVSFVPIALVLYFVEELWSFVGSILALFALLEILIRIGVWKRNILMQVLSAGAFGLVLTAAGAGCLNKWFNWHEYWQQAFGRYGPLQWVFALGVHAWPWFDSWRSAYFCITVTAVGYTIASALMWITLWRRAEEVFAAKV